MEILDYIDIAVSEPEGVAAAVVAYMAERKDMVKSLDVKIRIAICKTPQTVRAGKNNRVETLNQFISASGVSTWKSGEYKFDFSRNIYLRGKQELHITAGESVALYQKLVRKQDTAGWPAFYSNMKRKIGENFLKGEL